MRRWPKFCLIAVVVLSVILSLLVGYRRYEVEKANKQVLVAVDYQEVGLLSQYSGLSYGAILSRLKAAGVGAVLVKEPTITELEAGLPWEGGPVWVKNGAEVLATYDLPQTVATKIDYRCTYLLTANSGLSKELAGQLGAKLPGRPIQVLHNGSLHLVGCPASKLTLEDYGLGFGGLPWEELAQAGLKVIPQIRPWPVTESRAIDATLAALAPYRRHIAMLLFDGETLPGYPNSIPDLAAAVRVLQLPVGLIEFSAQKGLNSVAKLNDKDAIRLHSIRAEEMATMSVSKALDRLLLATGERNIRALVVRFFLPGRNDTPSSLSALEFNLEFLQQLQRGLVGQGLAPGASQPFRPLRVPRTYFGLIALGSWAAAVLLLGKTGLGRRIRGVLAVLGLLGLLWLLKTDLVTARQAAALIAAIVFPVLAIVNSRPLAPGNIASTVFFFLRSTIISLAGALLVIGLLADVGFMLQLDQFLGTKAALITPPVLLFLLLWVLPQGKEETQGWLASPVTWFHLLVILVVLAAGCVYLIRAGNEGAAFVPTWEKEIRQLLDNLLLVRPRTKEFLLGHPLLLLGYYLGYRKSRLALWLVGSIGQASMINTFAHIHTPLAVSALRTFNGLWLGIVTGLILIAAYRLFESRKTAAGERRILHAGSGH